MAYILIFHPFSLPLEPSLEISKTGFVLRNKSLVSETIVFAVSYLLWFVILALPCLRASIAIALSPRSNSLLPLLCIYSYHILKT